MTVTTDDKTTKRQKDSDDRRQNDKKTVTLFLRAPLVAIGDQKDEIETKEASTIEQFQLISLQLYRFAMKKSMR